MADYPVFLLLATLTVLSPGPGVLFTIGNAINHGLGGALAGSLGIAMGALMVAALSMTGVGFLLATSDLAFAALKYAGAAYLLYLGGRLLWRVPSSVAGNTVPSGSGREGRVRNGVLWRGAEGVSLQLTNPKAVFFFLSVFPQFIDPRQSAARQSALLVVGIHMGYAVCAGRIQRPLSSARGRLWVNRISGLAFLLFGGLMAFAQR